MPPIKLKKVIRGARDFIENLASLGGAAFCIESTDGTLLWGEPQAGATADIVFEEQVVGTVRGTGDVAAVAALLAGIYSRETEKRQLATETLERYKELTLLYDASEALADALDVAEVGDSVVKQTSSFLSASGVALYLFDRGSEPECVASTGDSNPDTHTLADWLERTDSLERRAVDKGHAELVASTDGAVICAPLKTEGHVFGLLRATHEGTRRWTAGDIKLVTSIAAFAASSISHARAHGKRMREQAIRNRVERFISPAVMEALGTNSPGPAVALFIDLGAIAATVETEADTSRVFDLIDEARACALQILMHHDALVNVGQGDTLVALFGQPDTFADRVSDSLTAATELSRQLRGCIPGRTVQLDVGVARVDVGSSEQLSASLNRAAALQAQGQGRILLDEHVAAANDVYEVESVGTLDGAISFEAYEVHA